MFHRHKILSININKSEYLPVFQGVITCGSVTMEGCGGKTIHGFGVIKVMKEEVIVVEKGRVSRREA